MARLASALAVAAFVVIAVRTAVLAVPFMNPDNLAYLAWGQELRHGGLPTPENALTTPHPVPIVLMAAVGGIVSPLATWAVLATCGLVAVVLGATLVAWRAAGVPGVGGSLLALALAGAIWSAGPLRGVDWLAAGAIGLALAVPPERGRARLILLVLAGLVRPEAWLLPPLLVLAGDRRRVRAAIAWGVAAPGLWLLLFDGLLLDDPLLAFHRTDALGGHRRTGAWPGRSRRPGGRRRRDRRARGAVRCLAPVGDRRPARHSCSPPCRSRSSPRSPSAIRCGSATRCCSCRPWRRGRVAVRAPRATHRRRVGDPGGARPAPRHHA